MRILISLVITTACILQCAAADANLSSPRPGVAYEANRGQARRDAAFIVRRPEYTVLIGNSGAASYEFATHHSAIRMELVSGAADARSTGESLLASETRVYRGAQPSEWLLDIPNYSRIRTTAVYPGIDLVWTSSEGEVEYEFFAAPHADLSKIAWRVSGAHNLHIDDSGDLVVETKHDALRYRKPFAFQWTGGRRKPVEIRYRLEGAILTFEIGKFNPEATLIIDPVISYSALLGGTGFDAAYAIALDGSGNVLITGETASSDFPGGVPGRQNRDVFVTKLTPGGTIVYTTILGSTGNDTGTTIAADSSGNAFVGGTAGGTGFPTTAGALRTVTSGLPDGFVAKLDSSGRVIFCTLLGGSSSDSVTGIALDSSGTPYVTGNTSSPDFPVTLSAPQTALRGAYDGFVAKLNSSGSALIFSTYVGGSGMDFSQSIAVTPDGVSCIAGSTASTDLRTVNAIKATLSGSTNLLSGCLNSSGNAWKFLTYLGGTGTDQAQAVALDSAGNVYLTGSSSSVDFPITAGVVQTIHRGLYDAFVMKLSAAGNQIIYSTYLGGSASETGNAIAIDANGRAFVTGFTSSFDFPVQSPVQAGNLGSFDAFVSELSPAADALIFSTYLGGSADDRGNGIALATGQTRSFWVCGHSSSTDYPLKGSASKPTPYNAFITKIAFAQQVGTYRPGIWTLDANNTGKVDAGDLVFAWGQTGSTPVFGDWNGDGRTKIGAYYQGTWYLDMNGNGIWDAGDVAIAWGTPNGKPVYGDWNGDGRTKLGIFDAGTWYLDVNGNGILDAGDRIFIWGTANAIPVIGDWNGNGRSKIGVFDGGIWYLDVANTGFWAPGDMAFYWGSPTATPVVGDWSGDGRTKVGVFDNGNWFLDVTGNGFWDAGDRAFGWGTSTSTPIVGDWNGDGRAKVGVFSGGVWYLDVDGSGTWTAGDLLLNFGTAGDIPIAGRWR